MKQKYFLFFISLLSFSINAQTETLSYRTGASMTAGSGLQATLSNFSTCQTSVSATFTSLGYSGSWSNGNFDYYVNNVLIGSGVGTQTFDISAYIPITSVRIVKTNYNNWNEVYINVNVTSLSSSMPASGPSVSNVTYVQGDIASPLSATLTGTGTTLKWYTTTLGDNYSATGPTPSTATIGTTSYYVSQANASGCESVRSVIVVTVVPNTPATHLNFDGSNDFVNLGTSVSTALNGTAALTLEAWINPSALNGWNNIITDYNGTNNKFLLRVRNNNNIQFVVNGTFLNSTFTVPLNTWTHIAAVYDGSNMYIYANGNLIASQAATISIPSGSTQINIGSRIGSNTENFTGNIDDVRVWNVAKTIEQINGSKNCELAGTESGLIAYYNFNQGIDQANNSGATTLTATTGPNGTLTNFTLTGTTSNWLAGSPVTTGSIVPSVAIVTTPVVYAQGATASALTATVGTNGTGLIWYTTAAGGTGSTTAPTPSTASVGSTSYWVATTNANGCESARTQIVVNVIVANDNCSNAINLNVGSSSFNDFPQNVLLTSATNSGAPAPNCGNFQGGDVWYTVTVPVSGNVVVETDGAGLYNTGLEVYTGSCGALSLLNCDDNSGNGDYSKILFLGQTPGTVLYVRVWENVFGISNAQFQVSAYDYVVPATHLNFDGVNDVVDLGSGLTTYFTGKTQVTLQAWVRPETTSSLGHIVGNYNYPTNINAMQMMLRREGSNYAFWLDTGSGPYSSTTAVGSVVLNTWQHITGTWDGTTMKIYVNGVLANSAVKTGTIPSKTTSFSIGANDGERFDGDIDEVRIWDIALTATDIMNTMNCEAQAQPELVAHYKFNQGFDAVSNTSETTASDSSGNGYNGTLTGFALSGATSNWSVGSIITTGNICATLNSSDFENDNVITIYPNPSNGIFNVVSEENITIEVYDLIGKLIMNQKLPIGTNSFDISNFNTGVYLLKVTNSNNSTTQTHKLIKN